MASLLITSFFKKATAEELEQQKKRGEAEWAAKKAEEAAKLARDEERRLAAQKAKRPVGRPKKRAQAVVLMNPVDIGPEVETGPVRPPDEQPQAKKLRGAYNKWGSSDLWPHIVHAVETHPRSLTEALNYLQHIKKPGHSASPFDQLTLSTLKNWYERGEQTGWCWKLKKEVQEKAKLIEAGRAAQLRVNNAHFRGIFKDHPQVAQKIIRCLLGLRDAGQQVDSNVIKSVMKGVITADALELFEKVVGRDKNGEPVKFAVRKRFAQKFARKHLGWTWRRSTGAARKLPEDWELQGDKMAYRVAALCSMHSVSVPDGLVVNSCN
ncbi:hypothetical protein KFL_007030010, partial [Klebsormidium nitens]